MKNAYYEMLRAQAKRRQHQSQFMHDGVAVYHVYDGTKTRSYWDDTGFQLGSQWVGVSFVHPRYEYEERCSDYAHKDAKLHMEYVDEQLFANSTPIYKKVGKSRKKVHMWQMGEIGNKEFYDEWDRRTHMYKRGVWAFVKPYMTVKQCAWGRSVCICIPEEILDEDDLVMLCDIVKAALADPNYLKFRYGDYVYSWKNYVEENPV